MAANLPPVATNSTTAAVLMVGFEPNAPCGCTPITPPGTINLKLGKVLEKFTQTVKVGGSLLRILGQPFRPQWLKIRVVEEGLEFTGFPPDTQPIQGTVEMTNDCTPSLTILYSGAASAACEPPFDVDIDIENTQNFLSYSVPIPNGATVVRASLPPGVRADAYGDKLSITGTMPLIAPTTTDRSKRLNVGPSIAANGDYRYPYFVIMSTTCGTFKVRGDVVTPPPCTAITVVGSEGNPDFEEGKVGSFCILFTGSGTTISDMPTLPIGLHWSLAPGKLCVSGTPQSNACAKDLTAARCVVLDVTLINKCSRLRINSSIQIVAKAYSRPAFCAGVVGIAEVDYTTVTPPVATGFRRWNVQADYFPINTDLSFSLQGIASADGAEKFTSNSQVLPITATRTTGTIEFDVSGLGCRAVYVEAFHPTCAVMSRRAKLTNIFNINDDCLGGRDPNNGGDVGGAAGGLGGLGLGLGQGGGEGEGDGGGDNGE